MLDQARLGQAVEHQFRAYCGMIYGSSGGYDAMGEEQRGQLRAAFFAGATLYQGLMLGLQDPEVSGLTEAEAEAAAEEIFLAVQIELEEFAAKMAQAALAMGAGA
jgi:hypothetical protein